MGWKFPTKHLITKLHADGVIIATPELTITLSLQHLNQWCIIQVPFWKQACNDCWLLLTTTKELHIAQVHLRKILEAYGVVNAYTLQVMNSCLEG